MDFPESPFDLEAVSIPDKLLNGTRYTSWDEVRREFHLCNDRLLENNDTSRFSCIDFENLIKASKPWLHMLGLSQTTTQSLASKLSHYTAHLNCFKV